MNFFQWVFSNWLNVVFCFGPFIALVVLTFYLLNWLIAFRQTQIDKERLHHLKDHQVLATECCWLINDCPPEIRDACVAYQNPDIPCWQHFRSEGGGPLMSNCLECGVFRVAPVPEISVHTT